MSTRVIFMQRPLPEVLASQDQMLRRRGTYKEGANPAAMAAAFEKHLREVYAWLDGKPYVKAIRVRYHEALEHPEDVSRKIAERVQRAMRAPGAKQIAGVHRMPARTNASAPTQATRTPASEPPDLRPRVQLESRL